MVDLPPNFEKWSQMAKDFLGEEFWTDISGMGAGQGPKADVIHREEEVIVLMDLPGMKELSAVTLRVEGETLFVKGRIPKLYEGCNRTMTERMQGNFERAIPLGKPVSKQRSKATYRKGILEVHLPTTPDQANTKSIHISDT